MTLREIGARLDELDTKWDALCLEIDRVEGIWSSFPAWVHGDDDWMPAWLQRPYDEQESVIAEYRDLSRQLRDQI